MSEVNDMSVRIVELEAQLVAAPPAWGAPMAQPDSEGWWAFEGEFCISELMEAAHVKTIHLFESDDLDAKILGLYNGTFRKLLADPWEVQP